MLWLALLACRTAAPEVTADDAALRAWPFEGCKATPTGPGLAFRCADGPWVGIHEQPGTPDEALASMVAAMLEQGDGVERLRVDLGGQPATVVHIRSTPRGDEPETDLIVGAVSARPGMARVLIGEALPDAGRARAVYLMEYLAAHGAPSLQGLYDGAWETPMFAERAVPVPDGCLPGKAEAPQYRVTCLGESLFWSDVGPDGDPGALVTRGEGRETPLGGLDWTFADADCTIDGAPADACRHGRAKAGNPLMPSDLLVGSRRDGEHTWLVFCGFYGPDVPAFCRDVISER